MDDKETEMKYRKRPVVIEAWRWMFSPAQEKEPAWIDAAIDKWPEVGGIAFEPDHIDGPRMCIATPEGIRTASPGDYIIMGARGDLYPCPPVFFEATYEKVEGAYDYPEQNRQVGA